jgi:hypothetical protein
VLLYNPKNVQVGDRVLILLPAYLAGIIGVVSAPEVLSDERENQRWLIEVSDFEENIVVSLAPNEFQVLRNNPGEAN